jgi:hypothetical protein
MGTDPRIPHWSHETGLLLRILPNFAVMKGAFLGLVPHPQPMFPFLELWSGCSKQNP